MPIEHHENQENVLKVSFRKKSLNNGHPGTMAFEPQDPSLCKEPWLTIDKKIIRRRNKENIQYTVFYSHQAMHK